MSDTVGGLDLMPALGDWISHAACRNSDPDIFHGRERHDLAKWVCETLCPVKEECLAEALELRKTFQWTQTWGGVLFPRHRAPRKYSNNRKGLTHPPATCPSCKRTLGVRSARHYPDHKVSPDGPRCEMAGMQYAFGLLPSEAKLLYRVIAGESRRDLRGQRSIVDRFKREGLIVMNERDSFDITPHGEQLLKQYEADINKEK